MNIVIERALEDDVFRLIEVQNMSFYDDFIRFGECPSYNEKAETILQFIQEELTYKIIVNNEIVGDMLIRKKKEEYYYLRTFAIIPKYQNQGIGRAALKFIEEDNPNVKLWKLITPKQNKRNCCFYESNGYKNTGEIPYTCCLTLIEYEKRIPTS